MKTLILLLLMCSCAPSVIISDGITDRKFKPKCGVLIENRTIYIVNRKTGEVYQRMAGRDDILIY